MTRSVARSARCAAVLFAVLISGCSVFMRSRINELANSDISPRRFQVLAVLPMEMEGFGPQVAARARDQIERSGVATAVARKWMPEGDAGMQDLCPRENPPPYQGVVFVAWDRMVLRDCETGFVAWRASGGYAGVDAMVKRMVHYIRGVEGTR